MVQYYLDNRSNSRANTCINPRIQGVYLLDGNQCGATRNMVNHNNFRIVSQDRCIIQVSALSALDGRVLAYHGFNG